MALSFATVPLDSIVNSGTTLRVHFSFSTYTGFVVPKEGDILQQLSQDVSDKFNPQSVVYDLLDALNFTGEAGYVEGTVVANNTSLSDITNDIADSFNNSQGWTVSNLSVTMVEKGSLSIPASIGGGIGNAIKAATDAAGISGTVAVIVIIVALFGVFLVSREARI